STAPTTQIGIATGDLGIAGYRVGYSTRTRAGLGFSLLADWNSIDGNPVATTTSFASTDLWLKADYAPPSGRLGASLQLLSSSWHRKGESGRVDDWRQERRDRVLRFFLAERPDGLGFRLTGTLSHTSVGRDTLIPERALYQTSLELSRTWPRANVVGSGRFGFDGAPSELDLDGGWMPLQRLTLAGSLRHTTYAGDRTGSRAFGTAAVALPLGLTVRGEVAWTRDVRAPLDVSDTAYQKTIDVA